MFISAFGCVYNLRFIITKVKEGSQFNLYPISGGEEQIDSCLF